MNEFVIHDGVLTNYRGKDSEVRIPDTVTEIGFNAILFGSEEIKSIYIPSSVKKISESNFSYCDGLMEIVVDEENTEYTSINGALYTKDKKKLLAYPCATYETEITLPNGVEVICEDAFCSCDMEKIILPSSIKEIEYSAFSCCERLKEIELADSSVYEFCDGALYEKSRTVLHTYLQANDDGKFEIPNTVKEIAEYAFYNCEKLYDVVIPDGVEIIHTSAFGRCGFSGTIDIPRSVKKMGYGVFNACYDLLYIMVPRGCEFDEKHIALDTYAMVKYY